MSAESYYYQRKLREELVRRVDRNPRYSLRSFAVALGLQSSALSQILSGRRPLSTKVLDRILNTLEMTTREQKAFVSSIVQEKRDLGLRRISPELRSRLVALEAADSEGNSIRSVGLDEFRVIADWYHYAILELTQARGFQSKATWIAAQLGISVLEAKLAIERLIQFELLELKNGRLIKTHYTLDSKDKSKTSPFHRKRQKQILQKSLESLEHDPIEERNHSSITLCLDSSRVALAKAKIQKVMWELASDLVQGEPDRVYEMSFQLFPLQKKEGRSV